MMQTYHLCWLGLLVIIYSGSCYSAAHDDDGHDASASGHSRVKRGGWSMFRLGRGLQMLRLGKRGFPTTAMRLGGRVLPVDNELTPEEVRYILASMIEDSKTLSSRQVPVPRYGRDMDFHSAYEQSIEDDDDQKIMRRSAGQVELDEASLPRLRPAPRGGRFRRSTLSQFRELSERISEQLKELQNQERAVALPRIGRLSKERAVPIPRIG